MTGAENGKARHFKELKIWRKGMDLVKAVYRLTARFPSEEKFGLISQMRRCSVPSNIAEGQARQGTTEFLLFLSHANGSLAELETQSILAQELGFADVKEIAEVVGLIGELQRMLAAMRRVLRGH